MTSRVNGEVTDESCFCSLEKTTHHDGYPTNEPRWQMRAHIDLDILTHRAHSCGDLFRLMIGRVMGHGALGDGIYEFTHGIPFST